MKVLFICSGNATQGISPIISRQANSLQDSGVSVDVFSIKGKGLKGYYNAIFKLKSYLKNNHYDILHAHYGLCGLVVFFASGNQKKVISFMGDDLLGERDINGRIKFTSVLVSYLNRFLAAFFFEAIIVKSIEMASKFQNSKAMHIIPNGVNTHVFFSIDYNQSRKAVGFEHGYKYVLFVSNPERPEKNFQLAKSAVDLLNDKKYKLEIVQNANEERLRLLYNAADVVLMSSFHEGSPNVIKEALACSSPIVSTAVGDVEELLKEVEGCYISPYDKSKMAEKIEKAADYRRLNHFTNGREKVLRIGLDAPSTASRIISIYKSILKN